MSDDPFELVRFVHAQEHVYATALAELRGGAKRSHWLWFVFPQVAGLGHTFMAQRYAIGSQAEAEAYLLHPLLGLRLRECVEALLGVQCRSAEQIMGSPDDVKLQASLTLFAEASAGEELFRAALEKYFAGERDQRTLDFLARERAGRWGQGESGPEVIGQDSRSPA